MDSSIINALTIVQPQSEVISKLRPHTKEGDETVQIPFIEFGDVLVQDKTVDPAINNEVALVEESISTIGATTKVMVSESPIQSN